ncbi:DUF6920 family protein [Megalodesulfovibrio paquesii]
MSRSMRSLVAVLGVLAVAAGAIAFFDWNTRLEIARLEEAVILAASPQSRSAMPQESLSEDIPAPVQRYLAFSFPGGVAAISGQRVLFVEMEMEGQFRRPHTSHFAPTTARQVLAANSPDMVFSARTPLLGPLWAIAFDAYLQGAMRMQARLLSTFTVMDQPATPALNRISLRRWLLESPLCPPALLPGGIVRWEAIDDSHARAIAKAHGEQASLVATFGEDGQLESFDAEEDGDLSTPYHGSGERVRRSGHALVDGIRIPLQFEVSRVAKGVAYPFWRGRITSITFTQQGRASP